MNFRTACDYALRSPTGSESLSVISESIRVLDYLDSPIRETLRESYPEAMRAAFSPRAILLLSSSQELTKVELRERMVIPDCWPHISLALRRGNLEGLTYPGTFRIKNVTSGDVVRIYDLKLPALAKLSDGRWRPTPADLDTLGCHPSTWQFTPTS